MDTNLVVHSDFWVRARCARVSMRKTFSCDVNMAKKSLHSSTISICWIWLKTHLGPYTKPAQSIIYANGETNEFLWWICYRSTLTLSTHSFNEKVTKQWIIAHRTYKIWNFKYFAHNSNKSQFLLKNHELKVWKSCWFYGSRKFDQHAIKSVIIYFCEWLLIAFSRKLI